MSQRPYNCSFEKYLELNDSPDSPYYKSENRLYVESEYGIVEIDTLRRLEREKKHRLWVAEMEKEKKKLEEDFFFAYSLLTAWGKEHLGLNDMNYSLYNKQTLRQHFYKAVSIPHEIYADSVILEMLDYIKGLMTSGQLERYYIETENYSGCVEGAKSKLFRLIKLLHEDGNNYTWEGLYNDMPVKEDAAKNETEHKPEKEMISEYQYEKWINETYRTPEPPPPGPTIAESIVKVGICEMPPPLIDSVTYREPDIETWGDVITSPAAYTFNAIALAGIGVTLYIHTGLSPFWLIEKLIQLCLK